MPKLYIDKLRDEYEASRDAEERAYLAARIERLLWGGPPAQRQPTKEGQK